MSSERRLLYMIPMELYSEERLCESSLCSERLGGQRRRAGSYRHQQSHANRNDSDLNLGQEVSVCWETRLHLLST